jgi:NAD(P) transhydrogenase subunit alpha
MKVGVPRETTPGEQRVALVPELIAKLAKAKLDVIIESGAGEAASWADRAYEETGARVVPDVWPQADVLLKVQPPSVEEVRRLRQGAVLIGFLQPYTNAEVIGALAKQGVAAFAMELMPRITRAQSMDALSAMSTVSGYKAVLLAAARLNKFYPLLMTAAGTVQPARLFVIGAGVAGLQAIGTGKRLGAVVEAYDTRPVVREQVESLGGKFVELGLETGDAQDQGGYARAQSEQFYARQQAVMAKYVAAADVVISTALVPGKRAPVLITEEMVKAMRPGSIIVDLAAEAGGNCAATEPGKDIVKHGVLVMGPVNLPATMPLHASQMYSRTLVNFLSHLVRDGALNLDLTDELTRGPLVTNQGQVVHEVIREAMSQAS